METQVPSDLALDFLETQAKQVREYKDDLVVVLQSSISGMRKKGLGECLAFPRPLLSLSLATFSPSTTYHPSPLPASSIQVFLHHITHWLSLPP